ncbi:MAG: hypothetical protein PWP27_68 [Clostridiales bacterium]|jgi:hypothetical protein|nr:hypothetical protein [Clostridiales bacterium]
MFNKKLQATVNINNDGTFLSNNLKELHLEYYIVENDLIDKEQSYQGKAYGVEIVKKELMKDNNTYIEHKLIENIYCCEHKMEKLVEKLAHHTVTPVGLSNVLEDIVGIF